MPRLLINDVSRCGEDVDERVKIVKMLDVAMLSKSKSEVGETKQRSDSCLVSLSK